MARASCGADVEDSWHRGRPLELPETSRGRGAAEPGASGCWAAFWLYNTSLILLNTCGFHGVGAQLEEAAYTEGANQWQVFRYVMLLAVSVVLLALVRSLENR